VVVGTGGVLHMGERDVAVPYNQIQWAYQPLRVCPETSGRIAEFSEHEAD
jgi:hypothetical protein